MTDDRRFDFGPVFEVAKPPSVRALARRLQVQARQVYRWMHNGLSHRAADRVAVRLGYVPYMLWPEWLTGEPVPKPVDWVGRFRWQREERQRAEGERQRRARQTIRKATEPRECRMGGHHFEPNHPAQLYCSMGCAQSFRSRSTENASSNPHQIGVSGSSDPHPQKRMIEVCP